MTRTSRLVVALASLLLLALYVAPLWRIELIAPQYPEGLGLRIWVNQISGLKPNDLNSINGLNHYIGMRAIDPEAIPELRLMPRLIAAAVVVGLLVALAGRRWLLYLWAGVFTLGAVAGLDDRRIVVLADDGRRARWRRSRGRRVSLQVPGPGPGGAFVFR